MKALLNKINIKKVLVIYIILQPIIDVITSLLVRNVSEVLTLGVIVRALFMVGIALYSLFICDKKYRTKMLIYYTILAIYLISFIINMYLNYGTNGIVTQIKGLVKTFYLPIILVALIPILKDKNNRIDYKILIYSLFGYILVIFLAKIFGIGYATYGGTEKAGTVGLFFAANEIGAIICTLAPILILCLINNSEHEGKDKKLLKYHIKNNILYILTLILYIFSLLEMGTKAPFFGAIGLAVVAILVCVIQFFSSKKKLYLIKAGITILITLVTFILVPYNSIGINIKITNGISFPKISDIIQNFEKGNSNIQSNNNQNQEQSNPLQEQDTPQYQSSLISGRDDFLADNLKIYKNSSIQNKILGIGYMKENADGLSQLKLVEMDYFDIALCHGVIGFIVYFAPFIILAVVVIRNLFKNIKKAVLNKEICFMLYSVIDVMGAALLAGHVLTAPASGIFVSVIIIQLHEKLKELENRKDL